MVISIIAFYTHFVLKSLAFRDNLGISPYLNAQLEVYFVMTVWAV